MYSFELSQSLARAIVSHLVNRKNKLKVKVSKKEIKKPDTAPDYIDYDGMGNYGRFPCKEK